MTALVKEVDLSVTGGDFRRLASEISANPFAGSLLSMAADGYVRELVAGEPFAGICRTSIPTANAASADGASYIEAIGGQFVLEAVISGIGQDDAALRRKVYASDDATLTFTAKENTYIGEVIGVDGTKAIILCRTTDVQPAGFGNSGVVTLADAAATLTHAHLDKVLLITPTTGRTLTLPPAADCAGRFLCLKVLAAFAVTLDGNASENIDGATTFAACDAAQDTVTIYCDGAAWHIVAARIA
jgi:hypothetical protein